MARPFRILPRLQSTDLIRKSVGSVADLLASEEFFDPAIIRDRIILADQYSATGGRSGDADAKAFCEKFNVTNSTDIAAVEKLTILLKRFGLWPKGHVMSPIVGATQYSCSGNLKDPRDLDAAFRMAFFGGWTFASTGMTPNGTTGYANTFYTPSVQMASGLGSIGIYNRTNTNGTIVDMGAYNAGALSYTQIWSRFGDVFYGQVNTDNSIAENVANTDSRGWNFACRTASNSAYIQRNATQNTGFTTTVDIPTVPIYISARNDDNVAQYFCNREIAFVWIGEPLTTAEALTLRIIVQGFQSDLGRQIGNAIYNEDLLSESYVYVNEAGELVGGSGTTYNDTLSQSVTAADTASALATMDMSLSEPVTVADAVTSIMTALSSLSESATMGDSYVGGNIFNSTLSESITPADAVSVLLTIAASITENTTLDKAVVGILVTGGAVSDSVTLGDNYVGGNIFASDLTEAFTPADAVSYLLTIERLLTEAVTPADALATIMQMGNTLASPLTVGAGQESVNTMLAAISEGISVGDGAVGGLLFISTLSEEVTVADTLASIQSIAEEINEGAIMAVVVSDGADNATVFAWSGADWVPVKQWNGSSWENLKSYNTVWN